jgi:hypothetical protein
LQDFVNLVKFLILRNLMKKITGKMLTQMRQLRHYSGAHDGAHASGNTERSVSIVQGFSSKSLKCLHDFSRR